MKTIVDTNIFITKFLVVSMLSLLLILIGSEANAKGAWGSKLLLEKNRPNRNWINFFPKTADVIVNDSISNAINSCDDIVGKGNYCVVEIGNTAKGAYSYDHEHSLLPS